MTVLLPNIGITSCERAKALVKNYPQNIVGSFWVMAGYGFDTEGIPDWWIDIVLKDNQAQAIVDAFEHGEFRGEHQNPLYLGFCILVVASPNNPADLSYVIQHLRMWGAEGIGLLKLMAERNISAHTEVTYPEHFLSNRYKGREEYSRPSYDYLSQSLEHWSVEVWEDYCSYMMARHGQKMFASYLERN